MSKRGAHVQGSSNGVPFKGDGSTDLQIDKPARASSAQLARRQIKQYKPKRPLTSSSLSKPKFPLSSFSQTGVGQPETQAFPFGRPFGATATSSSVSQSFPQPTSSAQLNVPSAVSFGGFGAGGGGNFTFDPVSTGFTFSAGETKSFGTNSNISSFSAASNIDSSLKNGSSGSIFKTPLSSQARQSSSQSIFQTISRAQESVSATPFGTNPSMPEFSASTSAPSIFGGLSSESTSAPPKSGFTQTPASRNSSIFGSTGSTLPKSSLTLSNDNSQVSQISGVSTSSSQPSFSSVSDFKIAGSESGKLAKGLEMSTKKMELPGPPSIGPGVGGVQDNPIADSPKTTYPPAQDPSHVPTPLSPESSTTVFLGPATDIKPTGPLFGSIIFASTPESEAESKNTRPREYIPFGSTPSASTPPEPSEVESKNIKPREYTSSGSTPSVLAPAEPSKAESKDVRPPEFTPFESTPSASTLSESVKVESKNVRLSEYTPSVSTPPAPTPPDSSEVESKNFKSLEYAPFGSAPSVPIPAEPSEVESKNVRPRECTSFGSAPSAPTPTELSEVESKNVKPREYISFGSTSSESAPAEPPEVESKNVRPQEYPSFGSTSYSPAPAKLSKVESQNVWSREYIPFGKTEFPSVAPNSSETGPRNVWEAASDQVPSSASLFAKQPMHESAKTIEYAKASLNVRQGEEFEDTLALHKLNSTFRQHFENEDLNKDWSSIALFYLKEVANIRKRPEFQMLSDISYSASDGANVSKPRHLMQAKPPDSAQVKLFSPMTKRKAENQLTSENLKKSSSVTQSKETKRISRSNLNSSVQSSSQSHTSALFQSIIDDSTKEKANSANPFLSRQ